MTMTATLSRTVLLAAALLACDSTPKRADTAKTDTATGPVENLEPAPPAAAEESRMGQMPLLRAIPGDSRCDSSRHSTGTRFVLQGDAPLRIMTTEVGHDSSRAFAPLFLEVTSKQARGDGKEENERIYVGFTPTGGLEMGQRTYFLTGSPPNDAGVVSGDDVENAKQLALNMLQRCRAT